LYLYDSDFNAYSTEFPNPVPGNQNAQLGLTINGAVSGSGMTIIRTVGDLILEGASTITPVVGSSGSGANANDIELSAEAGSYTTLGGTITFDGNFHNLVGATLTTAGWTASGLGKNAVVSAVGSRFIVFSTTAPQNFGEVFNESGLAFNGLGPNGAGAPFVADTPEPTFASHQTPIVERNGTLDGGTQNGFVFLKQQTLVPQDEASKFFRDVLKVTVFTGVDATAKTDNLPPESPPTIWTSSYHIYLQEQQQKEDEQKKKHKKYLAQYSALWEANSDLE